MTKSVKILFLNSGLRASNWGLRLATQGLLDEIQASLAKHGWAAEIDTVSQDYLYLKSSLRPKALALFIQTIFHPGFLDSKYGERLFGKALKVPRTSDQFEHGRDLFMERSTRGTLSRLRQKIEWADAVIFQGEGSAYLNGHSARAGLFLLWLAKSVFGKKVAFLNGSLGVTSDFPPLLGIARRVANIADEFAVREPASFSMSQLGGVKDVEMIPDSAFLINYSEVAEASPSLPLGLHGKSYISISGGMLPILEEPILENSYFFKLCKSLRERGRELVFFGIDPEDMKLEALADALHSPFFGPKTPHSKILRVIGDSEQLISGRYHHLIFALAQGVPVVPFSTTSQKVRGLAELYPGLVSAPFDPTSLSEVSSEIFQLLDLQSSKASELRNQILSKSAEIRFETRRDYQALFARLFSQNPD